MSPAPTSRTVLVVAHPGHELRVHHWLEITKPRVLVLTDGSGSTGRSRLAQTLAVLERAGAEVGGILGRFTDREIYAALLRLDVDWATTLAAELAREVEGAEGIVADAAEGFNPSHDLCRLLVNAVVERAGRRGWRIENREFPLEAAPDRATSRASALYLRLDDAALERKIAAAHGYEELRAEVERALEEHGAEAFRHETLTLVEYGFAFETVVEQPPAYETFGEQRVRDGLYRDVVRYREHFEPMVRGLRSWSERAETSPA